MDAGALSDVLNLDTYPLDELGSSKWTRLVEQKRADWSTNGAMRLAGLVRPGALVQVASELAPLFETASFRHSADHNIYFTDHVADVRPDHPVLTRQNTSHRTLSGDQLIGTTIRAIYDWDPLRQFIQSVLELPELYRMADPMACLNVMSYGPGDQLGWHFDRAKFAVTLLLQAPDGGGAFEYRRNLRTETDPNLDGVGALLSGDDDSVRSVRGEAGTMTVFAGFRSPHRVAPVTGTKPRIMAVLGFTEEPEAMFSERDRVRFYGRPTPDGFSPTTTDAAS